MVLIMVVIFFASITASAADPDQQTKNVVLDPVLNVNYEYYDVCGCTEKEVQCDLTQKAINCSDGKKYDSVTNWKVTWDYKHNSNAGTCATASFTVTVDVVFHLPKWERDAKASPQLSDKWDGYVKKLLIHEVGHKDRAMEAAKELTNMIAELAPARSCAQLDREVDRICRDRLDRLLEEQQEYDKATDHGRGQGAVFP